METPQPTEPKPGDVSPGANGKGNGVVPADHSASNGRARNVRAKLPVTPSLDVRQIRLATIVGVTALACWFAIFAMGIFLPSTPHRKLLLGLGGGPAPTLADLSAAPNLPVFLVLLKAAVLFGPTNIGLLCVVAGLVGGCAANISWYRLEAQQATDDLSPRQSAYLRESPWNAVLRSFLIYLLLMAGLLAFMPDPFKLMDAPLSSDVNALHEAALQQGAYARLAALASVVAFMIGYDPSRLDGLSELVPGLGKRREPVKGEDTKASST